MNVIRLLLIVYHAILYFFNINLAFYIYINYFVRYFFNSQNCQILIILIIFSFIPKQKRDTMIRALSIRKVKYQMFPFFCVIF